jgi:hypothetical protein
MVLGPTQFLREMSTRNLPGGKGRPVREADNPTAICEPTKCGSLDVSQPYRLPRPVTVIALPSLPFPGLSFTWESEFSCFNEKFENGRVTTAKARREASEHNEKRYNMEAKVTVEQLMCFFLNWYIGGAVQLGPLGTAAYCASPGWLWWRNWWNDDWQRKPKYSETTCSSAALPTTNPTWSARTRTRAAATGSQRLTAWATARPKFMCYIYFREWTLRNVIAASWMVVRISSILFTVWNKQSIMGKRCLYVCPSKYFISKTMWRTSVELAIETESCPGNSILIHIRAIDSQL